MPGTELYIVHSLFFTFQTTIKGKYGYYHRFINEETKHRNSLFFNT